MKTTDPMLVNEMMLGTSISAFIIILAASLFGIPISATHTVIGVTIGAGLAGVDSRAI